MFISCGCLGDIFDVPCQAPLGRAFAIWQYSRAKLHKFPRSAKSLFSLGVSGRFRPAVATLSRATVRQNARKRTCANSHPTFPTRMACPHPPRYIANIAVGATFNANLGVMQHFVNTIIRPLHREKKARTHRQRRNGRRQRRRCLFRPLKTTLTYIAWI